MWVWLAAGALAHPVANRHATHTTRLQIYDHHVAVTYVAEVPHSLIQTAGDDPVRDMAAELTAGLLLQVNDTVVAMTRTTEPMDPRPSRSHSWLYTVHLEAPLADDASRIRLSNANLPDASGYFAAEVQLLDADRRIQSSSVGDTPLVWSHDEDARSVWVELEPAPPTWPWWAALAAVIGAAGAMSTLIFWRPTPVR